MILEDRFGSSPHSRLCRNLGGFKFADVTLAGGGKVADRFSAICTFVAGTVPVFATVTS